MYLWAIPHFARAKLPTHLTTRDRLIMMLWERGGVGRLWEQGLCFRYFPWRCNYQDRVGEWGAGGGGARGSPFYFYTAIASCFESAGFIRDARGHVWEIFFSVSLSLSLSLFTAGKTCRVTFHRLKEKKKKMKKQMLGHWNPWWCKRADSPTEQDLYYSSRKRMSFDKYFSRINLLIVCFFFDRRGKKNDERFERKRWERRAIGMSRWPCDFARTNRKLLSL